MTKWLQQSVSTQKGRCFDRTVTMLTTKVEGTKFETTCARDFSKTLSVRPAGNGSLQTEEDEEKEKWRPASLRPLLKQVGSLTATPPHSHWPRVNLCLYEANT